LEVMELKNREKGGHGLGDYDGGGIVNLWCGDCDVNCEMVTKVIELVYGGGDWIG
jgi:hypothetical protein